MPEHQKRFLFVLGTRPEAIKLAPVVLEARRRAKACEAILASTGQHREMLDAALEFFGLHPDYELAVMMPGQTLADLTSRIIKYVDSLIAETGPDTVIVQGDTTTAMAAALAAFYRRVPVAHVEAGLRTDRPGAPFPEEINRRIISQIARLHFAPTEDARDCLLRDRIDLLGGSIVVTGNTVIDALLDAAAKIRREPPDDPEVNQLCAWLSQSPGRRMVLVTGHRRENFGAPFEQVCMALRDIAGYDENILIVYPVHLNPGVQAPVRSILGGLPNIRLLEPKGYAPFVQLMMASCLIITDSGGVQEEAPALSRPVLVTRDTTERPEAVRAGAAKLVGTNRKRIVSEVLRLLSDPAACMAMTPGVSPYGDGRAAARCTDALLGVDTDEFSAGKFNGSRCPPAPAGEEPVLALSSFS